ncbi:hypothetical protein ScPMuIL_017017 [Solemya velum]
MVEQLSYRPCTQNPTYELLANGISVNNGCKAKFRVDYSQESLEVECSSKNGPETCDLDIPEGLVARNVEVVEQFSFRPCTQYPTYELLSNGISVNYGCKAKFQVELTPESVEVECSSNNAPVVCDIVVPEGLVVTNVEMVEQLSYRPCIDYPTVELLANGVSVNNGCKAKFRVEYGSDSLEVECSSKKEPVTCNFDIPEGLAATNIEVVEQFSFRPCTQSPTYEILANGVSVNNGCKAKFRVDYYFAVAG